jgi:hypothetical protein
MIGFIVHCFTITVDHNISQFQILVNDVYRMRNLSLLPESRTGLYYFLNWVWVILRPTFCRPACLGINHPFGTYGQVFISVLHLRVCCRGALPLTRRRACRLQWLLALAIAVIFGSESRSTGGHILLSQILDFIFVVSYDLQGYGGGIRPRISTGFCPLLELKETESESYVTTDGQPASLSWNEAPIWGLRPDLYYLCDSYGLFLVGRLLWRDCQRNLSRVQVPWDLRPYFTVSD